MERYIIVNSITLSCRCNGLKTSPAIDQILNDKLLCHTNYSSKNKIGNRDIYNNENDEERTYGKSSVYLSNSVYNSSKFATHVKLEEDLGIADKIGSHSIIGK